MLPAESGWLVEWWWRLESRAGLNTFFFAFASESKLCSSPTMTQTFDYNKKQVSVHGQPRANGQDLSLTPGIG